MTSSSVSISTPILISYRPIDIPETTGQLRGKTVTRIASSLESARIAQHSESIKTGGLKNKIVRTLSSIGSAIKSAIERIVPTKSNTSNKSTFTLPAAAEAHKMLAYSLNSALNNNTQLIELTAKELKSSHSALAKGNGPLRKAVTALQAIQSLGSPQQQQAAESISNTNVAGIKFSQWGDVGRSAGKLVQNPNTAPRTLEMAAIAINQAAMELEQLANSIINNTPLPTPSFAHGFTQEVMLAVNELQNAELTSFSDGFTEEVMLALEQKSTEFTTNISDEFTKEVMQAAAMNQLQNTEFTTNVSNGFAEEVMQTLDEKQNPVPDTNISNKPEHKSKADVIASQYESDNDLGIGGGRSATDLGKKTTLDAISYLAKSTPKSQRITLSSEQINTLQKNIANNTINSYQLDAVIKTKGDLQIVRELALSSNPQSEKLAAAGTLGISISELASPRPNIGNLLFSLHSFIHDSNQAWAISNKDTPEKRLDAGSSSTFNQQVIAEQLKQMPVDAKHQAFDSLNSRIGERIRGVIEFAIDKIQVNQEDPVAISTTMKYATVLSDLMESLIHDLRYDPNEPRTQPLVANIQHLSELSPIEKAGLARVNISQQLLED